MSDETGDQQAREMQARDEELTVIDGGVGAKNAVLKTLTMTGFKSFVTRTHLEFAPGITAIIGPNGSGKCLRSRAQVALADGTQVAIGSLVEEALRTGIVETIDDGFIARNAPSAVNVMSLDPDTLELEERPVSAFVKRTSPPRLLRVHTRAGRRIEATPYHPLFTIERGVARALRADQLLPGAFIALPRQLPLSADRMARPFHRTIEAFADDDRVQVPASEMLAEWGAAVSADFGGYAKWRRVAGLPAARQDDPWSRVGLRAATYLALEGAAGGGPVLEPTLRARSGGPIRIPETFSPDLAYFLGLTLAEAQNLGAGTVRFVNRDRAVTAEYCRLAEDLFGLHPSRLIDADLGAETSLVNSVMLTKLVEDFGFIRGSRSAERAVPSQLFGAPEHVQWAFLSGLFEGDGYLSHRTCRSRTLAYFEYATASETLARGVVSLLLRVGVFATVREKEKWAANTAAKTRRTYWSVYVYGSGQLRCLGANLRFVGAKRSTLTKWADLPAGGNPNWDVVPTATDVIAEAIKLAGVKVKANRAGRAKLAAYAERRCHASRQGIAEVAAQIEQLGSSPESARPLLDRLSILARSDVYWDEVVRVEEFDSPDEWVYDLCVDDTHNFVADDVIVHNSNVADAIRWALGENNARVLRAKKNEELIFAGSETRRSLGMAEAVLQLDNSSGRLPIDYREIEVGRRLYKNGEAEYLVNRSKVRLRDLQDVLAGAHLADNPFVVIGQGLVDQVLALRPSDRRTVIEEAAGTRRLHLRREDALGRLKHAETELIRVIDILREIGPRVATLTDQVAKWNEYEVVRADLRRRALRWYRSSFGTTATARNELVARLTDIDREIERLADTVAETEAVSIGTDEELRTAREEEERRRLAAGDAAASEASVRERIAALAASLDAIAAERDRTRASLATLPAELGGLRERRATVDHEAAEAARRARESADAARVAEEGASRTRVALAEAQAARVETERAHLLREGDEIRLGDEAEALTARAEELAALAAALAADRASGEAERSRLDRELATAREAVAAVVRRHEAATARAGAERSELQRIDGELALARGQAAALREAVHHAEAELAARAQGGGGVTLPRGLRWLHERLTVADHLELAVRAALGDAVAYAGGPDALVDLEAARGVSVLVANDRPELPVPDGCTRLLDLLELDADIRPIAAGLLRNVFVATASRAAAYRAASAMQGGVIVTLDGMSVSPGIIRLPDDGATAAQQATQRLRAVSARLTAELAAAEQRLGGLAGEQQAAADRAAEVETERRDAEASRAGRESEVARLAAAEADVRDTVRAAQARTAGVEREQAELRERLERVATERAAATAARATAAVAFADARQAEDAAVQAHGDTTARAEAARLDAATSEERRSSLVRLRDTLDEQVGATERRIADEEERVRALVDQGREASAKLGAANAELERVTVLTKEATRSAEIARERSLAAEGSRRESELRLAKARERLAELRGERSKLGVEEERASGALRLLEEQVRAELGLPDDEPLPDPESIELDDEGTADEKANGLRDLQRLRRRLIALEPVNPLAATELAEIGERHSFLATQRTDLEKAIADLRSLADELATTIAEQFSTTFQAVDREFGVFFQRLFNGGQASLRTSDAEPDEAPGIDIYARPPGKRIGSLQQLSGGERALTATALLLAILRVKPAPFCVLDEVDAALDERNVGRFTEALRELTDRTQFIVVTHNRKTIEAADTLYGVSMDEGGSSKLISMKLADLSDAV